MGSSSAPAVLHGVPVIDAEEFLSLTNNENAPPQEVVGRVTAALEDWGVFQLVNHGVDSSLLDRHLAATKRFFGLPEAAKQAVARRRDNAMGYNSKELTRQKLDLKQVFDFRIVSRPELPDDHAVNADPSGVNQWPAGEQEFRHLSEQFARELSRLAFKLLEVVALGLSLPQHGLHQLFKPASSSRVRLNHYPVVQDAGADSFGVSHHKDSGFLTVLLQDDQVPGLQVCRDGQWHMVDPIPGAFTINAGDMLQVLSNDRFVASNHRVLRSVDRPRHSRVLFVNPTPGAVIKPVLAAGADAAGQDQAHYRPIDWSKWYLMRLDGNYADLGEESQIEWYRTGRTPAAVHKSKDTSWPTPLENGSSLGAQGFQRWNTKKKCTLMVCC